MVRRAFSEEFKEEAIRLVVEQGYPFSKACGAVGIGETALRRWVAQWRAAHSLDVPSPAQLSADARRIKELEARVAEREREREVLKKIHGLLRQGARTLLEVIQAMEKAYPVALMCRLAGVARSSYYAWRSRQGRSNRDATVLEAVRRIHEETRRSYGSRRMSQALRLLGHNVGRYRARSLMRQARLVRSKRVHRYRAAQAESLIAPNLLARRFDPAQRDQVWVGDITFVQTRQGWLYVAVVMDLYARRVVGWAFSQHADTDLALKALRRAYDHRRPPPGLMFHSDQGCQYTSTRFLAELRARGTIQSMSRRGNCWDNAVVERFFRSLKNEWIGDQLYVDHRHAEQDITDYLVDFYNHRRLHSAAKGLPPARFEALAAYPGAVSKVA
ncbi:IS3-like element ISBps2 family transposase [Burkholderia pseudomallei]|uniref:IS3-like element ISBps2 family transposase n=1 Tax=Burkholderia pseudomallei TaxID=28450 RepID=UPI00042F2B74|nr:IS3-like element ISBps2 family transposase [Burkholderia pseudomallei]AHK67624.1 transposase family protein [Burkholderia pseudomallei MSHR520]